MNPCTMTRIEAEALTGEIVAKQLQRAKLTSEMELKITAVRESYEGRLDTLVKTEASLTAQLREWAESHPGEFPQGERSIQFVHARIGLRTNPPKVEKIGRKLTWENVLDNMRRIPALCRFIRTPPEELNKQALIEARDTLSLEDLRSAGLTITQGETFYIDPIAQGVALEGMRLVHDWLEAACDNGNNVEARSHMLAASIMGATAFQKGKDFFTVTDAVVTACESLAVGEHRT